MANQKVTVKLGDFTFGAYEVPKEISFGGRQKLAIHELVGGARVIDSLGRSDAELAWSGLFLGADAITRARYLDGLRIAGGVLTLSWSEFSYQVVIESFKCSFERTYKLPYSISCQVVADNSQPVLSAPALSYDAAIMADLDDAGSYADAIGDGPLSGLMTTLNTATRAVSSFSTASQEVINSVLGPIQQVRQPVSTLTASIGNTILNVSTFGGTFGTPAGLQNQLSKMEQSANLMQLDARLQRMQLNVGMSGASPNSKTITVSGGNLYQLASKYYGDASRWYVIANANGMTDPVITGQRTLVIPPKVTAINSPISFKAG